MPCVYGKPNDLNYIQDFHDDTLKGRATMRLLQYLRMELHAQLKGFPWYQHKLRRTEREYCTPTQSYKVVAVEAKEAYLGILALSWHVSGWSIIRLRWLWSAVLPRSSIAVTLTTLFSSSLLLLLVPILLVLLPMSNSLFVLPFFDRSLRLSCWPVHFPAAVTTSWKHMYNLPPVNRLTCTHLRIHI